MHMPATQTRPCASHRPKKFVERGEPLPSESSKQHSHLHMSHARSQNRWSVTQASKSRQCSSCADAFWASPDLAAAATVFDAAAACSSAGRRHGMCHAGRHAGIQGIQAEDRVVSRKIVRSSAASASLACPIPFDRLEQRRVSCQRCCRGR